MRSRCWIVAPFLALLVVDVALHAEDGPAEKVTYDDHIRPIFRQYCLMCHRGESKKGDLALDTYAAAMEGGASGEVVYASDLDSSRLWDLVTHADEPAMPPNADKLPEDQLALIRRWIEGGTLENSGSVAKAPKKSGLAMRAPTTGGKPDGPAAMPASLYREPVVYSRRPAAVTALAASPWAPLVAVAGQRQASLYHSESCELLGIVPFPEGIPHILEFSRDGALLLVAGGHGASVGLAALYDVRSGSRLLTVGDEFDVVLAADVHPSRSIIALGGPQKVVRVYATADGSLAYEIKKHTDWITAITFSPDSQLLATADRNGGAFIWEAETGREVASLRGQTGAITSAAWRGDSQVVATAGEDGSVRLWEPEEGKQVKSWTAHGGGTMAVRFSADGRLVTAGRDGQVKLWKPDGGHLKDLASFADIGLAACFTHDGKRVAAGDFTGEVRLLDAEKGQQIALLPPNPPTLAMRTEVATSKEEQTTHRLNEASTMKQAADQGLTDFRAELERRQGTLDDMQSTLVETQSARDAAAKDAEAKKMAAASADQRAKEAEAGKLAADEGVKLAEAELAKVKESEDDPGAAERKMAAAIASAEQVTATAQAAQTALADATRALQGAARQRDDMNHTVAEAEQNVQATQTAVDDMSGPMKDAEQAVAAKVEALAARQKEAEAAQKAAEIAKAEQADFSAAMAQLTANLEKAEAEAAKAKTAKQMFAEAEAVRKAYQR